MKKLLVLLTILAIAAFSTMAFADEVQDYQQHVNDDGTIYELTIDHNVNVNLEYVDRDGYLLDSNNGTFSQKTNLDLRAQAYIPCYLFMTVKGNEGKSTMESFGPNANLTVFESRYFLAFDNEIGGFVNEDWSNAGHGRNAELAPGTGYYIQACDQFRVELYSNDAYRYEVSSSPLKPIDADVTSTASDDLLDLQMRYKVDESDWSSTYSFTTSPSLEIGNRLPCESMIVMHHFRVPYLKSTAHGHYSGTVTFKAYTI